MRKLLIAIWGILLLAGTFEQELPNENDRKIGPKEIYWLNTTVGVTSNRNHSLTTVNAAPPAIQTVPLTTITDPKFTTPAINTAVIGSYATGQSGLYSPGADINLIEGRHSFETWAAGSPTGWTSYLGAGSILTQDTTNHIHGLSSAKLTQTGNEAVLYSPCSTTNIGSGTGPWYVRCFAKKTSGTASCGLLLTEYSDGACATYVTGKWLTSPPLSDVPVTWTPIGKSFSSSNTIGSWIITLACNPATAVTSWDACELYPGTELKDSLCVNDADTTAACDASITSGTYQLSATKNWHISKTVSTPYDWSDTSGSFLFYIPPTAGDNNKMNLYINNDALYWEVYTSAGVQKQAIVACAKNAHQEAIINIYHTKLGNIKVCCDSTCGSAVSGATIATPSSTFYLGNNASAGYNTWIDNLKFFDK
jgi:hypothetical protein